MLVKYCRVRYVWVFAFCYTVILSLLFQKFLLPLLPSMHAGFGLLKNDAYFYHQSAQLLANIIHADGWSTWSAWSARTNTSGNVAILAALYAIFTPEPALIIPVNAFFHATSAVILLLIGRDLWHGPVGNIAGLIAALLFIIFPSALSWYSQPLKDSYVIAGVLMILYSWVMVFRSMSLKKGLLTPLALMIVGIFLVAFVKPYYLKLLLVASVLILCAIAIIFISMKHLHRFHILAFYLLASILLIASIAIIKPFLIPSVSGESYESYVDVGGNNNYVDVGGNKKWSWSHSSWLPDALENNLMIAAKTRVGMIQFNQKVGAGSLIDEDSAPKSALEIIKYLPRALLIGLFSPFPDTWLKKPSAARLIAVTETVLWYIVAPGLLFALYYRRSPALAVLMIFAGFFLTVFSFVTPNVGTLYRYRYAYEFLLIVVALGGWIQLYFNCYKDQGSTETEDKNAGSNA